MMLPEPKCERGYPWHQIEEEVLDANGLAELSRWMYGQTMMLCQGQVYNHEAREYDESCGGVAHGSVVYRWDLERFIKGGQIID